MRNRVFVLTLATMLLLPQAYALGQTTTVAPTVTASRPPASTRPTPPPPSTTPPSAATAPPSTTPPPSGPSAFDQLSPGGQRIALSLYQAQAKPPASSTAGSGAVGSGTGGSTPTRLTLDQIAQRKVDGHGWGQVFKSMKSEGLVTQKNLGQVVSSYNHRQHQHHGDHGYKRHDGDRHEGYARREGHDRHEGYEHREGRRMYSRDERGGEGRRYEGRGDEGRRYEARTPQGSGGSGEQGSRVTASSRPTYTAARSPESGRSYQTGGSGRPAGGNGGGHSK